MQHGYQVAILKVTSLKINRLLPIATNNMHVKFEIEKNGNSKAGLSYAPESMLPTDWQMDR